MPRMDSSSQRAISLTEDQALVLFEYFERAEATGDRGFSHAAEYLAMQHLHAQVCKATSAMFEPEYVALLASARARIAHGFEGKIPGLSSASEA